MLKSDLKNGMVIVTRNGRNRLVTDNGTCYNLKKGTVACLLSEYNDDLTSKVKDCFDVVAVYSSVAMDNLVWERVDAPQYRLTDLKKGWIFHTKKGNDFIVGKRHKEDLITATNLVTGYVWSLYDNFVDDDIVEVYDENGQPVFVDNAPTLDDVEKAYLSSIIAPFKDRDIVITKASTHMSDYQRITIQMNSIVNGTTRIDLPFFKADSMYKGLEVNVSYSLQDLGL